MKSVNNQKGSSAIIFAERLRSLRGGKNQRSFALELGLAQQTYARYELGRVPKPDILDTISVKFGVTVGWLLGSEFGGPGRDQMEDLTLRHAAKHPANAASLLSDLVIAAQEATGEARVKLLDQATQLLKIIQHNLICVDPSQALNPADGDGPAYKSKIKKPIS